MFTIATPGKSHAFQNVIGLFSDFAKISVSSPVSLSLTDADIDG